MGQTMRISILRAIVFCSMSSIFSEPFIIEKPQARKPLHMALVYQDSLAKETAQSIYKFCANIKTRNNTLFA